jgi:ABC-2 type transport system ATP-binding protein
VALVAALACDVELLLLDEPTAGLDPLMEAAFRECLFEERRAGRTVLLSSHILAEVEAVCDRVTIIRRGRTVETGALTELRHLTRTAITADLRSSPAGLEQLDGVHNLQIEGTRVHCQAGTMHLDEVMRRLLSFDIIDLKVEPPTFEDLFLRHYQHDDAGIMQIDDRAAKISR